MISRVSHISDIEKRAYYLANSRCICCGKALKDPISERYGIGPECRRKHGFETPNVEADWKALAPLAAAALRFSGIADFVGVDFVEALEKRRANDIVAVLIRWLSAYVEEAPAEEVFQAINGIRAAGWNKLSEKVAKRITSVHIAYGKNEYQGKTYETLEIETPYSITFNELMRKNKGFIRKDGKRWYWTIAASRKAEVWAILKTCFGGGYGYAEGKGVFVI